MILDDIYTLVDKSSSEAAFNRGEVAMLYSLLTALSKKSVVVELGVEFGRSTTCIGLVAQEKGFSFTAIDNWSEQYSQNAKEHVEKVLLGDMGLPIKLLNLSSKDAYAKWPKGKLIDLIHVDANHQYKYVLEDCRMWLPLIKKNGYACFDDYGFDSLPGVYQAVTDYMEESKKWKFIGRYGNKLGVFQKIL